MKFLLYAVLFYLWFLAMIGIGAVAAIVLPSYWFWVWIVTLLIVFVTAAFMRDACYRLAEKLTAK